MHVSRSSSAPGCGCRGIQADREAKAQAERARLRTKNSLRPVLVQLFQYYLFAALFYVNCIRVRIDKSADACPFQVNVNGRKQGEYRKKSVQKRRHQLFPSSFEWIKYERLGVKTAEAPQKPWCICIPFAVQMGLQEARRREEDEQRRREDEQRRREEETSTELEACSNSKKWHMQVCRSFCSFWKLISRAFAFHVIWNTKGWLAQRPQARGSSQRERYIARMQIATLSTHDPPPSVWTRKIWLQNHRSWLFVKVPTGEKQVRTTKVQCLLFVGLFRPVSSSN